MGVDSEDFVEIVVGAFAAAVIVFFRVYECGEVVEVLLADGSWVLGRIETIYDGDEKHETTYDIAFLDEGYDRGDFFVDLKDFELPDPALPFAIGAPVVDLDDGRLGRIQDLPISWVMVQFPYDKEPQSRRRKSLRVIPEAQAAPSVAQRADTTLLLSGVTATFADGSLRIRSIDGKPDFVCSVLDTLNADLNKALSRAFKAAPLVYAFFKNVDASNQGDYWHGNSGVAEELRPTVNRSLCAPDGLSKMLMKKLAAHEKLLEMLCRQSSRELPKPKAPPPESRVAVHFSDGVDYNGTVAVALDETRVTVQFDDGTSDTVRFPDRDVRVTRVGPAPAPPRRGQKRKSDDDESDDEPPTKRARQSKKRGSSGSDDEPAPKRRRTYSEPDDDGWDDELPELPEPDEEDGWD